MPYYLVVLAIIVVTGLSVLGRILVRRARDRRIAANEKETADTVCEFARLVKTETECHHGKKVQIIDFSRITIPRGTGYRISLELSPRSFRIFAVPQKYQRSGRLSFYTDETLMLRATDHAGDPATGEDPEYAAFLAASSQIPAGSSPGNAA